MKSIKRAIKTIKVTIFLSRFFSIAFIVFIIFYSASYLFVLLRGKNFVIDKLQGLSGRKVSMTFFNVTPPLNLDIKNLEIEGLAKAEEVVIAPSIPYLLFGNIALNKVTIINPQITYERGAAPVIAQIEKKSSVSIVKKEARKGRLHLILKRLKLKNGTLNFIDHTTGEQPLKIAVNKIDINISNLYTFPYPAIANFDFSGMIPWQKGKEEGKIRAEGWLNFYKRDMQATLKIEDIDGVYLYPYYAQWVDLEKARIDSAKLKFTSDIQGLNNNVLAQCHLELTDIVRKPRPPEESAQKAEKIADAVLGMFKELDQGKIVLNFNINTKMDDPKFGMGTIRTAVEEKITKARNASGIRVEGFFLFPVKLLEGMVKGTVDLSKAVVDGTFAVGNEIKKSVEGAFKKEPVR